MKKIQRFVFIAIFLLITICALVYAGAAEGDNNMSYEYITNIQLVDGQLKKLDVTKGNYVITEVPYSMEKAEFIIDAVDGTQLTFNNNAINAGEKTSPVELNLGNTVFTIKATKGGKTEEVIITVKRLQDPNLLYKETYRPQFHNSPQMFLMNDPNGLIYNAETKEYHLYYQYAANLIPNEETKVWAHAVSKDLVYWETLPIAIYPDEFGEAYSGSAVIDYKNTSGLFDENTPPEARMVLFYTSYSGKFGNGAYGDQCQSMAYSLDNGVTWIKYENNPVIKNDRNKYNGGFRDPKVIWYEDSSYANGGIWLMVVAGGDARLFTSENLIDWEYNGVLRYETNGPINTECPDFFPMAVNGDPNNIKWVYMGSIYNGGNCRVIFAVGDFEKRANGKFGFKADFSKKDISVNGNNQVYSQQTFFNDAKGRRIAINWIWDWVSFDNYETGNVKNWLGVHTLPVELKLVYENGEYDIQQVPVEELKKLRFDEPIYSTENKVVAPGDKNILDGVTADLYEIEATFNPGNATKFGFKLCVGSEHQTLVYYDAQAKQLVLDRTNSGVAMSDGGPVMKVDMNPTKDNKIQLRVFIDTSIIDIYGNDGMAVINTQIYPGTDAKNMVFFTEGDSVTIESLNIYKLDSIYFSQLNEEGDNMVDDKTPVPKDDIKKNNNKMIPIIIAIVVCVLVIAGIIIVITLKNKGNNNPTPTISPSIAPTATDDNVTDKKTTMFELPANARGKAFWEDKKMAILGDSITAMNGFQSLLRELTDLKFIYNNDRYAISGTQLTGTTMPFTERAPEITKNAGVIMVFGGTNDFHVGAPLGTINDPAGTDTFYAALRKVCESLKQTHPDAVVFFATPLQRSHAPGNGSTEGINAAGLTLEDYANAIINICTEFEYPVLDLYHTSQITKETADNYLFDGLHPNTEGFAVLAKEIAKFMCPDEV